MRIIELIPAIVAHDLEEIKDKIQKVEPYVKWVQLDIMDGKFVDNLTWNNPRELKNLKTNLDIEVHLMIGKPEEKIDEWIQSGAKRIIFHYEAGDKREEIIEKIKKAGLEAGLAINPETPIEVLEPFLKVPRILIMTVHPGRGGQKFIEDMFLKIKNLRIRYPNVNIEVDGGINQETAQKVIEAGANILIAGSYIFNNEDIKQAIESLRKMN